jgi:3-dehydroquinate synthase
VHLGASICLERGSLASIQDRLPACSQAVYVGNTGITLPVRVHLQASGESCKTVQEAVRFWDELDRMGCDRQACLVAIGGGALCDLAGFVASTYLRGISLVLVPTTLLAMVDAAIGGKNGLNGLRGKNRIGTTYLPKLTLIDPTLLTTLPDRQWTSGFAEVIKCAVLTGEESIGWLESHCEQLQLREPAAVDRAIEGAIATKVMRVEADLLDRTGYRAQLNFGHTLGHAIESLDRSVTHGEAVAIGMNFEARLAYSLGMVSSSWCERLDRLLQAFHLPIQLPAGLEPEQLLAKMMFDKKNSSNQLRLLLPSQWGTVELLPVEPAQLLQTMKLMI